MSGVPKSALGFLKIIDNYGLEVWHARLIPIPIISYLVKVLKNSAFLDTWRLHELFLMTSSPWFDIHADFWLSNSAKCRLDYAWVAHERSAPDIVVLTPSTARRTHLRVETTDCVPTVPWKCGRTFWRATPVFHSYDTRQNHVNGATSVGRSSCSCGFCVTR